MTTTSANISFIGELPTKYTPGSDCTALSSITIVGIDFASSCLPDNFDNATTAYYSPGTACPTGYTAQESCTRSSADDAEYTSIICCPVRGVITMSCVASTASLSDAWANMFCTWSAGAERRIFDVTQVEGDSTVIEPVTMEGGDGINAYGIKLAYASSDLKTTATGTSTTAPKTTLAGPTSTSTNTNDDSSDGNGLPTGATVGIAVAVPVVVIAALISAFFWYRRRKQRYGAVGSSAEDTGDLKELPPATAYAAGSHYAPSELHAQTSLPPQEMPGQTYVSELPADTPQATSMASPGSSHLAPTTTGADKSRSSPNVHNVSPAS